MAKTTNLIGSTYTIPAGTRVRYNGQSIVQKRTSTVTVVDQVTTSRGKTAIVWHRGNRKAQAVLK